MNLKSIFFLVILALLIGGRDAQAWNHKPRVGLGFTNNAYYTDVDQTSDTYWLIASSTTKKNKYGFFNLALNYTDYSSESINDNVTWRTGQYLETPFSFLKHWDWDFGAGGQKFTGNSPGTTEDAFDYTYLDVAIIRYLTISKNAGLAIEPGYQPKFFTGFDGRHDHRLYLNGSADINISKRSRLLPYAEFGWSFSNQSIYSRRYFLIGADWNWFVSLSHEIRLSLFLNYTAFPARDVSVETEITRRRGRRDSLYRTENETHNFTYLSATWVRLFQRFQIETSAHVTSQTSKSGFVDYSEFGVKAEAVFPF